MEQKTSTVRALLKGRDTEHSSSRTAPLISIVTVVRNGKQCIERSIMSVVEQSFTDYEYIIIDGGSSDGTIDIVKRYADKITFWVSEPDNGIYDGMNKGIRAARGTLINLLNADDCLEPGALQHVADFFSAHNRPSILCTDGYFIDPTYNVRAPFRSTLSFWLGMTTNHQCMFVHRLVYDRVGLYDTYFQLASDYDFTMRCVKLDVSFLAIHEHLVSCRNDGASALRSGLSRCESNAINRAYYGSASAKRAAFILFNYVWMPMKLRTRTLMYKILGPSVTRSIIEGIKRSH